MPGIRAVDKSVESNIHFLPVTKDKSVFGEGGIAQNIFQGTKQSMTRAWKATMAGSRAIEEMISFIFFRVIEWLYPTWSIKFENLFLRIQNVIRTIKDAWKQEQIKAEIAGLKNQNLVLQQKVQELEIVVEQNGHLKEENESLVQRIELQQQAQIHLVKKADIIAQDRDLLIQEKDLYAAKNATLQQESAELSTKAQMVVNEEDVQEEDPFSSNSFDITAKNGSMGNLNPGNKTLFLLIERIRTVQQNLNEIKPILSTENARTPIYLKKLDRTLVELINYHERNQAAFQLLSEVS